MKITVDVYHHFDGERETHRKLDRVLANQEKIMSELSDAVDQLEVQTAAISGAEESAEAAFTRLAQLIADLKTGTADPATIDRIKSLSDALAAKAAALGAAVANTPAS